VSSNVTLKQIAKELGISAMTVSRALNNRSNVNEKTREKILKKARSMGYTPNHVAKSLLSKKTYTIGIVIPEISHTFFAQVVRGIEEVTYEMNYQLILTNSAEDSKKERKALETLRAQRVDGILISCSVESNDFSYYKEVIDSGMPLVFFDRCIEGLGASTVSVNDKTGARQITQHMIDHGYKKIACLRGPEIAIGKERLAGYIEALHDNDIPVHEKWIVESGFQETGGYAAMKKLLELPPDERPRAVVSVNDPAAIGAIEAIEEYGLPIPDDIAIVGFGDMYLLNSLNPLLATVLQSGYEIGRQATKNVV
jgi:DNA-binding LacI/PurR family transcriptional regulator